ncbi:MAG TPA: hypothetical protein VHF22_14035, partial [Planctomycetota bacterium]|nr:hypothetical protein [Planctomycetota bacterium]
AEPQDAHAHFCLGLALVAAGELSKALDAFLRRVELGGDPAEVYCALYEIATIQDGATGDWDGALASYLRAYQARPSRAEPLHQLAFHYRKAEEYHTGYIFARAAAAIPMPEGEPRVRRWVYQYGIHDELSICAYWVGAYRESLDAADRALTSEAMPDETRKRVERNRRYAVDALGGEDAVAALKGGGAAAPALGAA